MKRVFSILAVAMLAFTLALPARAAGSVTFDSDADKFIFSPGTEQSPTSLFEDFQNVMPGDALTEQILIKNDSSNEVKIKVYIRSLGAQEATNNFLSQLDLTVRQQGESILFDAPADEKAQLADWVYLGTVYSGGEITLDVTLEVPLTLGNEYQGNVGYLDWQFKVEELPVEPSDPEPPKTADMSNLALYSGALLVSLAAIVLLLRKNMTGKRSA
jgi:hypothetical protein